MLRPPPDAALPEEMETAAGASLPPFPHRRVPSLVNSILVGDLGGEKLLFFRGMGYRVPPVPFREGTYLLSIQRRVQQLATDLAAQVVDERQAVREHVRLQERAAELFWRLVVPRPRLFRWLKARGWVRNPFLRASELEVSELLGFFLACRMTSGVVPGATARRPLATKTPPSTLSIM